ncbi:MAG: hypothetical protein GY869_31775, partial [Planctomycetes bacterium]|nr:hypothetical protein [Planctomycetota bacterium]
MLIKYESVQGEGLPDGDQTIGETPAITLSVTGPVCPAGGEVCDVSMSPRGIETFTVTPHVDEALISARGMPQVNYVMVEVIRREINTKCTSTDVSFQSRTVTRNSFLQNNYFHHLGGLGPDAPIPACIHQDFLIVSVEKSFEFAAINQRETGGGYAEYAFYIRGHYSSNDLEKWPGSHHTFRLRAVIGASPTARFDVSPLSGTAPLAVTLDGAAVTAAGTITMNSDHTLISTATLEDDEPPTVNITFPNNGNTVNG